MNEELKTKKISRNSRRSELQRIGCGDRVEDDQGRLGTVESVEAILRGREIHFYFKISTNNKSLLIIK